MVDTTAGQLLVGTPAIRDGIFDQAVVFMLHHDQVGALGVVLSSPTGLELDELLPRWADHCVSPAVVFDGGPVEPQGFIGLGLATAVADPAVVMPMGDGFDDGTPLGRIGTVDLESDPAIAAASIERLRIFRGYAGWAPGQLDDELARGAWFTVAARLDDLWSDDPTSLYERVLRRQSGELRWFANAPIDPSVN